MTEEWEGSGSSSKDTYYLLSILNQLEKLEEFLESDKGNILKEWQDNADSIFRHIRIDSGIEQTFYFVSVFDLLYQKKNSKAIPYISHDFKEKEKKPSELRAQKIPIGQQLEFVWKGNTITVEYDQRWRLFSSKEFLYVNGKFVDGNKKKESVSYKMVGGFSGLGGR